MVAINLLWMVFGFIPSGQAASFGTYVGVQKVLDGMSRSGAITVDRSRTTTLDDYPNGYTGDPAVPIAYAAMKANKMFWPPTVLVLVNALGMLAFGIFGGVARAPQQQKT
jgi:hypothetical protein